MRDGGRVKINQVSRRCFGGTSPLVLLSVTRPFQVLMPAISSSSGNRGGTSDDIEEMKLRRTPGHMEGQRSDPLESASTQMSDKHFLDTNEYRPVTIPPDVPPTRRPKLLGRLLRFGSQSPSTTASASQFLGRILGGSREGSPVPAGLTSSPQALSKTPSHSDPPPTVIPRSRPDDRYTSGDAVVGRSEMHSENRIIQYPSAIDLERSGSDHHPAPGPSNSQIASKHPAFEHESKTSINVNHYIYGGRGGRGGRSMQGRGGEGGSGEGPTVNYHIDAGANVNHIQRQGESGFHILHRASADAAVHNSAENYSQPKCHPETRTKMLEDLWEWSNSDPDRRMLWFYGPAGAGKSSVARSFCQKLEEEGRLGASFFFKRGHPSRGDGHKLFPTIAYQLCLAAPGLKHIISQILEDDPSITNRSLSVQLQKLIIEPCRRSFPNPSLVVVIDGLDECEDKNVQAEILRSFGIHQEPLPLLFFIASRPEAHIWETFISTLEAIYRPVNVEQSFDDVRKYLLEEFARIHRDHCKTMDTVPFPWPTPAIVDNFVNKSSGYFIYVATVVKFIDDKDFRPTERLHVITNIQEPQPDCGSPFAALDALYTQILLAVPRRPHFLKILAVIAAKIFLRFRYIDQLLELQPGEVQLAVRGLRSVIGAQKWGSSECNDWSSESGIIVHHASFLDFLQDPVRAGIFYVGVSSLRTDLCCHILKALSYSYDDFSLNRHGFVGQ
ncbi:NACHT domain-containing protein [Mycena venus]|uniref:NACHT domain-containing protein n=1 Tax=Mycena venus TaxID=2733690 RepID=A0A8H6Z292_9AGAR|nr:NACHT domain-containing protein [Mycena venus]